jgi:hypothetical protein
VPIVILSALVDFHRVRTVLHAGFGEQFAERDPEPRGVARVRAPDRVGDAGERDAPLDEPPGQQVGEGVRARVVDQAVDAQLVVGNGEARDPQGGVDAVERLVGGGVAGDAGHLECRAGRDGLGGVGRPGQGDGPAGRRAAHDLPDSPTGDRGDSQRRSGEQERPSVEGPDGAVRSLDRVRLDRPRRRVQRGLLWPAGEPQE